MCLISDAIMHLAAESHVDRSIEDASSFILTNINGTLQSFEISKIFYGLNQLKKINLDFIISQLMKFLVIWVIVTICFLKIPLMTPAHHIQQARLVQTIW